MRARNGDRMGCIAVGRGGLGEGCGGTSSWLQGRVGLSCCLGSMCCSFPPVVVAEENITLHAPGFARLGIVLTAVVGWVEAKFASWAGNHCCLFHWTWRVPLNGFVLRRRCLPGSDSALGLSYHGLDLTSTTIFQGYLVSSHMMVACKETKVQLWQFPEGNPVSQQASPPSPPSNMKNCSASFAGPEIETALPCVESQWHWHC